MRKVSVGLKTATAFTAAIEDPGNFKNSRSVGAWVGLTTKHYQSGEVDYNGHISRRADGHLRTLLYEAAAVMLARSIADGSLRRRGDRVARFGIALGAVSGGLFALATVAGTAPDSLGALSPSLRIQLGEQLLVRGRNNSVGLGAAVIATTQGTEIGAISRPAGVRHWSAPAEPIALSSRVGRSLPAQVANGSLPASGGYCRSRISSRLSG